MSSISNSNQENFESYRELDIKKEFKKYFNFWPWFIVGIVLSIISSFLYLRYTTTIYKTNAKVRILDKKEGLELPSASSLFSQSKINLENEIEGLKSYPILKKVSAELNLIANFYAVGHVKSSRLTEFPFEFKLNIDVDSINISKSYYLEFKSDELEIYSKESERLYSFKKFNTYNQNHDLPFDVSWPNKKASVNKNEFFRLELTPKQKVIASLKKNLKISSVGKKSEIINIGLESENKDYAIDIINKLINVYNEDGINDRRLIHKNTIDFINERFISLGYELDSIELNKQSFKLDNNLVDISTDVNISLQKRLKSDEELFDIKNEILLAQLLMESSLSKSKMSLLPSNIGLDNININSLTNKYNENILQFKKLIQSGGHNNPNVKNLKSNIESLLLNINESVSSYILQLNQTKVQLESKNRQFTEDVYSLPEKEKVLRSIERSQEIQESLYLFLLQKREEAEVSYAVTEPSLKVVEYALSREEPISPKKPIIILGSLIIGLLIPFGILYIRFLLNTKIQTKKDLESSFPNSSVLGEIPEIKEDGEKLFSNPNERSVLAEASRILSSNTNYLLGVNKKVEGSVLMCTSTIKGEGKTFVALNLSLAIASLNKKVLLIGADLRNPQIHNYVDVEKRVDGLSNYLYDDGFDWKSALLKPFKEHPTHTVLIGGNMPPNPVQLLTNGRLDKLLNEAKKSYDYIVMDCAPTLLVTDTLLISHLADATVYLTRANHTQKELLEHPKQLIQEKKLKNVGFVLNGVGAGNSYGYGYGYKYGYNYGYGYGYGSES